MARWEAWKTRAEMSMRCQGCGRGKVSWQIVSRRKACEGSLLIARCRAGPRISLVSFPPSINYTAGRALSVSHSRVVSETIFQLRGSRTILQREGLARTSQDISTFELRHFGNSTTLPLRPPCSSPISMNSRRRNRAKLVNLSRHLETLRFPAAGCRECRIKAAAESR
jgi:hypothetical protein